MSKNQVVSLADRSEEHAVDAESGGANIAQCRSRSGADMKATIRSHKSLPADHPEIHRFTFDLDDGGRTVPYTETV
ncbi:MAG: hypothetical protein QOG58_3289 [Caballeronia sp.]|jgi:hypothetical protein|nr:hypothetical protein [Caballeronia sp.]